ncbi:MAG: Mov34/MPN/PAD-1 family protein [Candidatus Pacebacteria bacterium]|nr:Mov34/MPN/PAD-1 family protein [Candidatus Paceibacterota bacterium]
MIPIHIKRPGEGEPPQGNYYIVAGNGFFLRKKMSWVDAVVRVQDIKVLENEEVSMKLLLPPLPARILYPAVRLAKSVYDISGSEVCLLLHHNETTGYVLTVPDQTVDPGSIDYDAAGRLSGFVHVGTIHSHGRYPAYHSETDLKDEEHSDGVHITVGSMKDYPRFSLSAEMVVNGMRYPIEMSWFEGLVGPGNSCCIDGAVDHHWEIPREWTEAIYHRPQSQKKYLFKRRKDEH